MEPGPLKIKPKNKRGIVINQARWLLVCMGVLIGIIEVVEHLTVFGSQHPEILGVEIVIYVIVFPLLAYIVLGYVGRTERERDQAYQVIDTQLAFTRHVSHTMEWHDLLHWIVEFPRLVLPVHNAYLFLRNSELKQYELAVTWRRNMGRAEEPILGEHLPQLCDTDADRFLHPVISSAEGSSSTDLAPDMVTYCLPMVLGEYPIAILQMELPAGFSILHAQEEVMNGMAPELAFAITSARSRDEAMLKVAVNETERRQVSQDLHDTLGQNLAYIRLKLDQLVTEEDPSNSISDIRKELGRMREVADEAYTQVRETLADLQADPTKDLAALINEQADRLGKRADFQVSLSQTGAPRIFRSNARRQMLYICREALNNIEMHSKAKRVAIQLNWTDTALQINVADDGEGFNPDEVDTRLHFGLSIMKERASNIGADLTFVSTVGLGTTVKLVVPYAKAGLAIPGPINERESLTVPVITKKSEVTHENPDR